MKGAFPQIAHLLRLFQKYPANDTNVSSAACQQAYSGTLWAERERDRMEETESGLITVGDDCSLQVQLEQMVCICVRCERRNTVPAVLRLSVWNTLLLPPVIFTRLHTRRVEMSADGWVCPDINPMILKWILVCFCAAVVMCLNISMGVFCWVRLSSLTTAGQGALVQLLRSRVLHL